MAKKLWARAASVRDHAERGTATREELDWLVAYEASVRSNKPRAIPATEWLQRYSSGAVGTWNAPPAATRAALEAGPIVRPIVAPLPPPAPPADLPELDAAGVAPAAEPSAPASSGAPAPPAPDLAAPGETEGEGEGEKTADPDDAAAPEGEAPRVMFAGVEIDWDRAGEAYSTICRDWLKPQTDRLPLEVRESLSLVWMLHAEASKACAREYGPRMVESLGGMARPEVVALAPIVLGLPAKFMWPDVPPSGEAEAPAPDPIPAAPAPATTAAPAAPAAPTPTGAGLGVSLG